jgi:RNase P/RNase MRP subunit p29
MGEKTIAKKQRVFTGGAEYQITGVTGRGRRVKFIDSVKVDGRELLQRLAMLFLNHLQRPKKRECRMIDLQLL